MWRAPAYVSCSTPPHIQATPQCIRALPYATGYDNVPLAKANRPRAGGNAGEIHGLSHGGGHGTTARRPTYAKVDLDPGRILPHALEHDLVPLTRPRAERGDEDHLTGEVDRRYGRGRNEGSMDGAPGLGPRDAVANDEARRVGEPAEDRER